MKIDITTEIQFKTARSGGKGGQHVNKVETMVEGSFDVANSQLLTDTQKETIRQKLANRINVDGWLQVRSQVYRSQLQNKEEVIKKMNELIAQALKKEKKRVPTKPSKAAKAKRLDAKKRQATVKESRRKIRYDD